MLWCLPKVHVIYNSKSLCTVGIEVATFKEQLQCIVSMCVTFISTKPPIYEHHVCAVLISYPGP